MIVELRDRTEEHAREYFYRTQDDEIKKMIPQKARSLREALEDYRRSVQPDSKSWGRTIYADGIYIGDVWCYCINPNESPGAMLSYCIFNRRYWGKGIASAAVKLFVEEIRRKYGISLIGAFTYNSNAASMGVLRNCNFQLVETFAEDGIRSSYFELSARVASEEKSETDS